MQLIWNTHQGPCSYCGTTVQTDRQGFGLHIRTACGCGPPSPSHGFPKGGQVIRTHHRCTHLNGQHTWRPRGHPDPSRQWWKIQSNFSSRQLKDHEMNYLPFLLEAAAAVRNMDFFNKYLRGKQFILYTDQKTSGESGPPVQQDN